MSAATATPTRRFDVEAVRRDFPILQERVHGKPLIYLDSANTSQKPRPVIDAEKEVYETLLKSPDQDLRDLAYEGYVEHGVLDDLLEKLLKSRKTETDEWKAHAKVLLEILERHMQEENERTCAVLEEHFTDEEREALGRRFTAAKARLNMKLKAA